MHQRTRHALLTGLLVVICLVGVWASWPKQGEPSSKRDDLGSLAEASRSISNQAVNSVVRIETIRERLAANEELQHLFGDRLKGLESQGSGLCVGDDLILTNFHVVAHARQIIVKSNREEVVASLVGADALTDLALLKAAGLELAPAVWGDSETLATGDFVWAVGHPFGLQRSVTMGIVSAANQVGPQQNVLQEFLQTDAAVNPGGSGGPLLNRAGEVIGVNTAILGDSFRGISFAIPSNQARVVADELQANGAVRRGWLGVRLEDAKVTGSTRVRVTGFSGKPSSPSPARATGIEIGDAITHWGDTQIINSVQLARLAARTKPGTTVNVTLVRNAQRLVLPVKITARS